MMYSAIFYKMSMAQCGKNVELLISAKCYTGFSHMQVCKLIYDLDLNHNGGRAMCEYVLYAPHT